VSAITVNALREALALQRYEEARARFGSRYTEYLLYLGVKSADSRLQRPEYLGGGRQTIQFSEVLATAETGATTDVGDMKGHGIAAMKSNRYRRYFEEHGIVMTMMSVRPKTMYMQGLSRQWNRRTKEDYWQKELQHIGQDTILNKEIYLPHATPDGTFGWQDRYMTSIANPNLMWQANFVPLLSTTGTLPETFLQTLHSTQLSLHQFPQNGSSQQPRLTASMSWRSTQSRLGDW